MVAHLAYAVDGVFRVLKKLTKLGLGCLPATPLGLCLVKLPLRKKCVESFASVHNGLHFDTSKSYLAVTDYPLIVDPPPKSITAEQVVKLWGHKKCTR